MIIIEKDLFPVYEIPPIIDEDDKYDYRYKKSYKWDIEKGDFVRNSSNQVVECDGYEAYMIWCYKIAQTKRYNCLAYESNIGTEIENAMKENEAEVVCSMIERTITDALLVNPRTEWVRDFEFTYNADTLLVSFIVKGVNFDRSFKVTI